MNEVILTDCIFQSNKRYFSMLLHFIYSFDGISEILTDQRLLRVTHLFLTITSYHIICSLLFIVCFFNFFSFWKESHTYSLENYWARFTDSNNVPQKLTSWLAVCSLLRLEFLIFAYLIHGIANHRRVVWHLSETVNDRDRGFIDTHCILALHLNVNRIKNPIAVFTCSYNTFVVTDGISIKTEETLNLATPELHLRSLPTIDLRLRYLSRNGQKFSSRFQVIIVRTLNSFSTCQ